MRRRVLSDSAHADRRFNGGEDRTLVRIAELETTAPKVRGRRRSTLRAPKSN